MNQSILGSEKLELVFAGFERMSSLLGDVVGNLLREADVGVKSSADGSASLGKLIDALEGLLNPLDVTAAHGNVSRELLAKSQRCGILGVRPSDFDDVLELVALRLEGVSQTREVRQQKAVGLADGGDVDHRREGVVGGLRSVAMIVGVDHLGSEFSAEDLGGSVGEDFVRVHV